MTGDARVRELRPADHPRLRAIQRATLTDPSPELLEAAVEGPLTGLVQVDAGRPVGYLLAVVGEGRAYLPELAVAPDEQGRGHGSALLQAALDRLGARGVAVLRVTARADDRRARRFYETRGFHRVETVPGHYESGADGVVYERRVD